jgi:hypothetical protein
LGCEPRGKLLPSLLLPPLLLLPSLLLPSLLLLLLDPPKRFAATGIPAGIVAAAAAEALADATFCTACITTPANSSAIT